MEIKKPFICYIKKPIFDTAFDKCSWLAYIAPPETDLVCFFFEGEDFVAPSKRWFVTEEQCPPALRLDQKNTDFQFRQPTEAEIVRALNRVSDLVSCPIGHQRTIDEVKQYLDIGA